MLLHLVGVADQENVGHHIEHAEADEAVSDSGEGRQLCDLLAYQGGAGI